MYVVCLRIDSHLTLLKLLKSIVISMVIVSFKDKFIIQGLQAYANSHINMRKSTPICEKSEKYAK